MAALRHYHAMSPQILMEFLTKVGPLFVVVVYAPTDQSSTEDKDHFFCYRESVMTRANGLTIVMGDFNTAVGTTVQGEVGLHGFERRSNNNVELRDGVLC